MVEFWLFGIVLVGGMRIGLRLGNLAHSYGRRALRIFRRDDARNRVVILGGGAGQRAGSSPPCMKRSNTHMISSACSRSIPVNKGSISAVCV